MEKIKIRDVTYAYRVSQYKQGLPFLLMLHGFMGDSRVFKHLIEELKRSSNPIRLDLLGHGASSRVTDPQRFNEREQVQDLLEIINTLEIAPHYLYGYSMGGRLALKTALASPGLFQGLILESTNGGIPGKEERKTRREKDEKRALEIEQDYPGFTASWQEKPLFQSRQTIDLHLEKRYRVIQSEQDPEALAASLRGFSTGQMNPEPGPFRDFLKPVLFLAGSDDAKYREIGSSMSRLFPLARLSILDGGHRVHLDNPGDFCRELLNFIDINHT